MMLEVNELEVLEFIKYNGPVTASELADRVGLEPEEAATLLARYTRQGLLRELMGIETKSDVRSRVSSREIVKRYVIAGRGESKIGGLDVAKDIFRKEGGAQNGALWSSNKHTGADCF